MPSPPKPLTAERIVQATEEVLRRRGFAKATVVDVARALGVSHASVYRHFASKAALHEAVTKRWLNHTLSSLAAIAAEDRAPELRLHDWLAALFAANRRKWHEDPELFAAYKALAAELEGPVASHVDDLTAQLAQIIHSGADIGTFAIVSDPTTIARTVFQATGRFHDSYHSRDWEQSDIQAQFETVVDLVLRGLRG